MTERDELLHTVLASNGRSLTKPRRVVFQTLRAAGILSMNELVVICSPTIDRASVYRTVELFERLGIVQRVQIGWKYKLELSDRFNPHHHHAVCTRCGTMTTLHEHASLEQALERLAKHYGYANTIHQLEIRGLCTQCQKLTSVDQAA